MWGDFQLFGGSRELLLNPHLAAHLCIEILKRFGMHPVSCELVLWGRTCAEYETANRMSG